MKAKRIAALIAIVGVCVGSLFLLRNRFFGADGPLIAAGPAESGEPGSICVLICDPPEKLMPALNERPNQERFPPGSSVQRLWQFSQCRTPEAVADIYLLESREKILGIEAGEHGSHKKTDAKQLAFVQGWLDKLVVAVLEYTTLRGEVISMPITANGDRFSLGHFVYRDAAWRWIMNPCGEAGLDLEYVVNDLQNKLFEKKEMLSRREIGKITEAAVMRAKKDELRDFESRCRAPLRPDSTVKFLNEEGDKVRIFLLRYPYSLHKADATDQLNRIKRLLVQRGNPPLKPWVNTQSYLDATRE